MKTLILTSILLSILCGRWSLRAQKIYRSEPIRFLALGDSYTIGQSVDVDERWPIQLGLALEREGLQIEEIRIIAQTGWRTDNLQNSINDENPEADYNLVSLLIGVNNQFQGGSIDTYRTEFEELLKTAIRLAGDDPSKVMVVSLPDYAYTPFGNGSTTISEGIDQFNSVNRQITNQYQIAYHDITPISRQGLIDPSLVASDDLHPSGKMYTLWVSEIMSSIRILDATTIKGDDATPELRFFPGHILVNPSQQNVSLNIYDTRGIKVFQRSNLQPGQPHRISLTPLRKGLYLVSLEKEGNILQTGKVPVF